MEILAEVIEFRPINRLKGFAEERRKQGKVMNAYRAQDKEHSLAADVKGLDMRMRLKESAWNTADSRAIEFSNVEQQISKF